MNHYLGVFGHTALDVILQVPKMPKIDSSIAVEDRIVRIGGTGANIARAASEMGVNVSLASFVGDDFPVEYMDALKKSGVNVEDVKKMKGFKTPTCWIVNDPEGNQTAFVDQGAMAHAADFELQMNTIEESEILHIGTGRPDYYRKVYDRLETEEKLVVFDPAQELEYVYDPSTFENFLKMSDYFFCNEREAGFALEYLEKDSPHDLLEYVDLVLITKGDEGSVLYLPGGETEIPAYEPDEIKEPTGAGDSFRAGFYAALYRDFPLKECFKVASARASFCVETSGPQDDLVSWEEVLDRYESQKPT
ncbi:MAG: carbohydrate kinase family protein [Thermoplasmata archaeon]